MTICVEHVGHVGEEDAVRRAARQVVPRQRHALLVVGLLAVHARDDALAVRLTVVVGVHAQTHLAAVELDAEDGEDEPQDGAAGHGDDHVGL